MNRPPLRVIAIAWGASHVEDFLEFCLPALLAAGNVPALTTHFDVEIVFVTETAFFDIVRAHPGWREASRICGVRLVPVDDLVATRSSYGMSVSYSLFRGFEDLGPAMTGCYMLFVNADFVLADGSYRSMLPCLLRGDPIVLAPSYCVIGEVVRPALLIARDPQRRTLVLPPRQMADLVLRHRHFTIRGKTVNQRFYSLDQIDQFYWSVNETTLLGRQHPVAVVAMKPERHLADLTSYWDYGIVAEFCPSLRFTVLGNSDDFLMLELRSYDTACEQLSLGWPTPKQIAGGLRHVLTGYTKAAGDWRLTLHSTELPTDIEKAHEALDRFAMEVYASLPEPLPHHLNHLQWNHHYPAFHAARARFLAQQATTVVPPTPSPEVRASGSTGQMMDAADHPPHRALVEAVASFRAEAANIAAHAKTRNSRGTADLLARTLCAPLDQVLSVSRFERAREVLAARLNGNTSTSSKSTGDLEAIGQLIMEIERDGDATLEAARQFVDFNLEYSRAALRELAGTAQRLNPTVPSDGAADEGIGLQALSGANRETMNHLQRLSYLVFGAPGRYRPWHWLNSSTRHTYTLVRACVPPGGDVLHLHGNASLFRVPEGIGSVSALPLDRARDRTGLQRLIVTGRSFDCCLIDADLSQLRELRDIYARVRPLLRPGGALIAMFFNPRLVGLPRRDFEMIRNAFPVCGPARIAYAGSWASAAAIRLRHFVALSLVRYMHVPNSLAVAAAMTAAAPFALLASAREGNRTVDEAFNPPGTVTSVAVEIKIG